MSIKQEVKRAFDKWEKGKTKIGFDSKKYKDVNSKVETLKRDLSPFADRFEDRILDNKDSAAEMAQDVYNDIRDNFVKKIAQCRNEIFSTYPGLKDAGLYGILNDMEHNFADSKNLYHFFSEEFKLMHGKIEANDDNETKTAQLILNLFANLFAAMANELMITEKMLAKDDKYFYDENNSWLISKIYRYLWPDAWRVMREKYDKHTVESVPSNLKIFPQGKPLPKEVKQGFIGDCYLMAALIGLAKKNPKSIEKCFVQGLENIENLNDIDIRFFCKEADEDFPLQAEKSVIITVNKEKVIDSGAIKGGALWPKLIEKAFTVYKAKGYYSKLHKSVNNAKLDSGAARYVSFAITGKRPIMLSNAGISLGGHIDCRKADVVPQLKTWLKKGRLASCVFEKNIGITDAKKGDKITLISNHEYTIVGIDESKKYVRLINPWKAGGRSVENSPKSKEGGHIAISFEDFENYVYSVDVL